MVLPVIGLEITNKIKMEVYWKDTRKDFFTFKRNALKKQLCEEVRSAAAAAILLLLRDLFEDKSQPSKKSRTEIGKELFTSLKVSLSH